MKRNLSKALKGLTKPVKPQEKRELVDNTTDSKKKARGTKDLPSTGNVDVDLGNATIADTRKTSEFKMIEVVSSKGQKYRIAVPASYVKGVPKVWEWDAEKYRVAELIAAGVPLAQIPDDPKVSLKSRMTIYCWLEHPEFKEHVDGLVLETGWASRRERLAKLQRVNEILLHKLVKEIDGLKLTDKSLGAVLSAIQAGSKLIAQDKGEFIEETKVNQETNMTAKVTNVSLKMDDFMASKSDEEKKQMEKEFDEMADDIIRNLTSE